MPANLVQVGVKHLWTSSLDFCVELVDRICLKRDFGTIFRGVFRTLDYVGFCAVPFDNSKVLRLIKDLECQAVHEQIETFTQLAVKDLRDKSLNH